MASGGHKTSSGDDTCGCGYHPYCIFHCSGRGKLRADVERERIEEQRHREVLQAIRESNKNVT